jgi:hypothetical protein
MARLADRGDDAAARLAQCPRGDAADAIAGLVLYLTSDDARGFTGQAFDLNNGAWMG